jgi:hypothetical protein
MPKPVGTCGATKKKIMAIICYNHENSRESYGYNIWQTLKDQFHTYIDDNEVRNVYTHLNGLCGLNLIARADPQSGDLRCLYNMTDEGFAQKGKYDQYLQILRQKLDV